jgi:hypothetical protein
MPIALYRLLEPSEEPSNQNELIHFSSNVDHSLMGYSIQ